MCIGKGVPDSLATVSAASAVDTGCFPPAPVAADIYASDMGSAQTSDSVFGRDPFATETSKSQCLSEFQSLCPDMQHLFSTTVNGDMVPLQQSLLQLIELTRSHSNQFHESVLPCRTMQMFACRKHQLKHSIPCVNVQTLHYIYLYYVGIKPNFVTIHRPT